ncbi:hypothetical protein WALSEDRAFT_67014 [Wallemia mellicola CBS 633.66]|uniref:Coatomer subunit epsilon n=1 Tax=Wallemia mellicola (strain ATCC MYA-4683 / CBS 633.66) TaxID=671144 RepID=I4YJM4_WALMC|nr:hypothetical protein WALSEDRAFT_67014 [Wallemia mellicola CBS 633.66]EIM24166.1 hypothetical protein WALSEDRAFT_67014 [Wallemia mellicola CBS 633.66]|eukprot:XP_006955987.1 hypothetical protein WALSEDRAFT_67014 [Wallemia mellicola CBS 633.66]
MKLEDIKQFYYQGSYQTLINAVDSNNLNDLDDRIKFIYSILSHLALKKDLPSIDSELSQSHIELAVIQSYIDYITNKEKVESLDKLRDYLIEIESEDHQYKHLFNVLAATIFWKSGEIEEALSTLNAGQGVKDVESVALLIQIYISISRLDLAKNEYQHARIWADDHYLIQLSEAWLGLAGTSTSTNSSYEQAYYVLEELPDRDEPYNKLLRAIAHGALQHFEEAQVELDSINSEDEYSIMNEIVISTHLKNKDTNELISRLSSINPDNILVNDLKRKSAEFDQLSKQFV